MKFDITYTAHYSKESIGSGYKPDIFVNGKWQYTALCNRKTMKGALTLAKRYAEELADDYKRNSKTNVVTVSQVGEQTQQSATADQNDIDIILSNRDF